MGQQQRRTFRALFLSAIVIGLMGLPTPHASAAVGPVAYGVSPFRNEATVGQEGLQRFDMTTAATLGGSQLVINGGPITGDITGTQALAVDPTTGLAYIVSKVTAVVGRVLSTVNLDTGDVTSIGNLGDNFASLTFATDGTLYGVTGDGAAVPETLFTIDKTTAVPTLVTALGNGDDGEVIAYNPTDDMIYHWSGNATIVFEKVLRTSPFTVTDIPISGATTAGEIFGAAFNPDNGEFIVSTIQSRLHPMTTAGVIGAASANALVDDLRGIVLDVAPVAVDDAATIPQNAAATQIDVLANDTNDTFGAMTVDSVTTPANGVATVTNGGADVSYAPNASYCNDPGTPDTFDYTLNGGSTATVTVTVPCPDVVRTLSLSYSKRRNVFSGTLGSADPALCGIGAKPVSIFRKVRGPDKRIANLVTDVNGGFRRKAKKPGTYYALAPADPQVGIADCQAAKSSNRRIRDRSTGSGAPPAGCRPSGVTIGGRCSFGG